MKTKKFTEAVLAGVLDRVTESEEDYPKNISLLIDKLDFKVVKVEKSHSGVFNLIGRPNDWVGYKDLRYLATVREVLKIASEGNHLSISVEGK